MRHSTIAITAGVILLIVLSSSASANSNLAERFDLSTYIPGETWTSTVPEAQNMSSSTINELIQFINESESRVDGIIITRNGYIVEERYWGTYNENRSHHIFSCTKSFTSALIGIAIKEGFIDNVSQRMLDFFPEYTVENPSEYKSSITIEHLLTMTHGLDWNEHNISYTDPSNMYMQMFYSADPVKFFLDLPSIQPPGEVWVYSTSASHILSAIIQRATGMTTRVFADTYLFGPMNAEIRMWTVYDGVNHGGTQLYITPRDFTKFGLLYLYNGVWGEQQILPEDWVNASTTGYVQLWAPITYGYQWWIDADLGGFMALGSEMQVLYVNPDLDLVVTITGTVRGGQDDISDEIILRVLDAVADYEPTTGTESPDVTQLLVNLGTVAIVAIVLVVGVWYYRSKL
ncbi:MAG: serine hydrolase domain-containing protein [Candidatus Thorarchaeota archaeon]|jgi:CubicO group peptidase (beta-lactamase class C family)